MRLSGHSYDNSVFRSLLEGLQDPGIQKTASKKPDIDFKLSQTTQADLDAVRDEELKFMADELLFAAKNAGVNVSGEDLARFAQDAKSQKLRGKQLERAARKFCSNIQRTNAPPQGTTRTSASQLVQEARNNTILPAGYNPEYGPNNSKTGGYLGMSKNPNTIWNSSALRELTQAPEVHQQKFGDEQIRASRESDKAFRKAQKHAEWQAKQDAGSDPMQLPKGASIGNVSTVASGAGSQPLPSNSMSIFSSDRDFNQIPAKTAGELLREMKETQHNKAEQERKEVREPAPPMKTDSLSFAFSEHCDVAQAKTSQQRRAVDKLFEGLASSLKQGN